MFLRASRYFSSNNLKSLFSNETSLNELKAILSRNGNLFEKELSKVSKYYESKKVAGVLVPFCMVEGEVSVLFTKRCENLRSHAGHVSFPGGVKDEEDRDVVETALRENEEEIGLERNRVMVLGQLYPMPSGVSKSLVTPVVGFCGDVDVSSLKINHDEVLEVFSSPLKELLKKENLNFHVHQKYNLTFQTPEFVNQKHNIWGLTASILYFTFKIMFPSHFTI